MASITPGRTWVTGESVTASKLNSFITSATVPDGGVTHYDSGTAVQLSGTVGATNTDDLVADSNFVFTHSLGANPDVISYFIEAISTPSHSNAANWTIGDRVQLNEMSSTAHLFTLFSSSTEVGAVFATNVSLLVMADRDSPTPGAASSIKLDEWGLRIIAGIY